MCFTSDWNGGRRGYRWETWPLDGRSGLASAPWQSPGESFRPYLRTEAPQAGPEAAWQDRVQARGGWSLDPSVQWCPLSPSVLVQAVGVSAGCVAMVPSAGVDLGLCPRLCRAEGVRGWQYWAPVLLPGEHVLASLCSRAAGRRSSHWQARVHVSVVCGLTLSTPPL